jgi:hypothetical protein
MRGIAVAVIALVAIVPFVHAQSPYTAQGTYKVGLAAAEKAGIDACLDPTWQGQTGDCVYMRSDAVGKDFELQARGTAPIVGLTACFFDAAKAPLGCQGIDPAAQLQGKQVSTYAYYFGVVPAGSAFMSVSSYAGASVNWLFDSQ